MARRRYRRYKKAKWAANIDENMTYSISTSAGKWFASSTIAENPLQIQQRVSQPYTVKNIEFTYYIDSDAAENMQFLEDVAVYIMYCPQGMTLTVDYNLQHPEYIMAYQLLGSPSVDTDGNISIGQQYQPRKIRTRLSRTLNTGDSIIVFLKGRNTGSPAPTNFTVHSVIRWWSKAN